MRYVLAAAAIIGGIMTTAVAPPAHAEPGYAAGNVHLRAGPGTQYPILAQIRAGVFLEIFGCVAGGYWCDVAAGPARGWVSGHYLNRTMNGPPVVIMQQPFPVIVFDLSDYWGMHYRDRPFYGERQRYQQPVHPARSSSPPRQHQQQPQAQPRHGDRPTSQNHDSPARPQSRFQEENDQRQPDRHP